MEQVFDAHMHFNMKADDPVGDFEGHFANNGLTNAVLILNTEKEIALFEKNRKRLSDRLGARLVIAGILDTGEDSGRRRYDLWKEWDYRTCVKVHPRVSGLTRQDFPQLTKNIEETDEKTVIIDCFEYGHHIENHVGIELGIHLAQRFPERRIILAHAGGHRALECMLYTRTLKNVYYDLALSCSYLYGTSAWLDLAHLVKYNPARVMFGSDYPDVSQETAIEKCVELCIKAGLDEKMRRMIFSENAQMIYTA